MKKLLFVVTVLILSVTCVKSQDKMMGKKSMWDIAVNAGLPTSTGYSFVFGADVEGDFHVAHMLNLTLSGGYENYSVKSSYGGGHSSYIPLLGGAKMYFSEKFYGHAQLGYAFSTVSGGGGAFAYAPSLGYNVSKNWDISIKYLGISSSGYSLGAVLARFAYSF